MWVRQCDLDALRDDAPPIPSRIVSNEEFVPPPPVPAQRRYEERLREISIRAAQRLGMERGAYLRTGMGMAAALLALNEVHGDCYDVLPIESEDADAFAARVPRDQFIFDVQTHHVDVSRRWYDESPAGQAVLRFLWRLRPDDGSAEDTLDRLHRGHYIKEIFGDSDTAMAVISGVPSRTWNENPLPPDLMVETRRFVNDLAANRRVLSHGLLRPNLGPAEFDEMERQVRDLRIDAWKMYTGAELGERAWFLDDEAVAYPFWERTRQLGVRTLCVHKGLPLSVFNERACSPFDVEKAARDWPDLNFVIYHAAYRGSGLLGLDWMARGNQRRPPGEATAPIHDNPAEIPWITDLCRVLRRNPDIRNVYFELGGTFHLLSSMQPVTCMHALGQMLQAVGPERILWGTDSIWNGSPQSQIERFRRLKIRDDLVEQHGYPPLTDDIKRRILGLNAARLFGIDVDSARQAIAGDRLTCLRQEYLNLPAPSQTQFGWVWIDEGGGDPTLPVGESDA